MQKALYHNILIILYLFTFVNNSNYAFNKMNNDNTDESPSWLSSDHNDVEPVPVPKKSTKLESPPKTFKLEDPKIVVVEAPAPEPTEKVEMTDEDKEALKGVIMFMRFLNMGVAIAIIAQALTVVIGLPTPGHWILAMYSGCGGCLICLTETQLSFLRVMIAMNFGFLFSGFLRFLFYLLIASVLFSFKSLFGYIVAGFVIGTAFYNTYVLFKYPAYKKLREKIAREEDAKINKKINERMKKEAGKAAWASMTGGGKK